MMGAGVGMSGSEGVGRTLAGRWAGRALGGR